jgi:hypothetical protein
VLAGADGSTEAATSRAGRAAAPQGAASAKPRLSFSRLLTVPTETAAAAAEASREVVVRAVAELWRNSLTVAAAVAIRDR